MVQFGDIVPTLLQFFSDLGMESFELVDRMRNANSDDVKSVQAINEILTPNLAGGEMSSSDRITRIITHFIPSLILELNLPTTHYQRFLDSLRARNWKDFQSTKALNELLNSQNDESSSKPSRLLKGQYELEIYPKRPKIGEEQPAKIGEEGPEKHEPHVEVQEVEGEVHAEEAAALPHDAFLQEPDEPNAEGGDAGELQFHIEDFVAGEVVQELDELEEEENGHAGDAPQFPPPDAFLQEPAEPNAEGGDAGDLQFHIEDFVAGEVVQELDGLEEEEDVHYAGEAHQFPPVPPDAFSLPLDEQATDLRIKLTEDGEDVYIPPKPQGPQTKRHS